MTLPSDLQVLPDEIKAIASATCEKIYRVIGKGPKVLDNARIIMGVVLVDMAAAEFNAIRARLRQRCIARLMTNRMTEDEAAAMVEKVLNAPLPWRQPTLEELDEMNTDPLPEVSYIFTMRPIDTEDGPLPVGSAGTTVHVFPDAAAHLEEVTAPRHVVELERSDVVPDDMITHEDMTPKQKTIVDARQ